MTSMQYTLASPIEFLSRLLDRKINESVGVTEETVDDIQRRYLFMEFISSETEYLEMLKLFEQTYLAKLNRSDHLAWQMTYRIVQNLVSGHDQLLRKVFEWLELPISVDDNKAEINWELHVSQIGDKFQSLDSLSGFIQVYVQKLLELEPHYKDYVYHYSLCNTFKQHGIFNAKLVKQLSQMEPMLKKFQQQRLNSQSTDLFRRNISFESLRHLPVARLGHYKVFFDSFLKSTEAFPSQTSGRNSASTNQSRSDVQSVVAQISPRPTASFSDDYSFTDNLEVFKVCIMSVQHMLLRIDGVNFSNIVDKETQRISTKLKFKYPEEYVPVSALGIPHLTGILNTVWVEVSESQKVWTNTVRSIDSWRRKKTLYPYFVPKGKQLGAFLYKSYLILARIPMISVNDLQNQPVDTQWSIKFALPLTNCKIIPIDKEQNKYNEIGLQDDLEPNIKLFKLEWFLYGDVFETIFVFDNYYDYNQWFQHLQTIIDLNGFTSKPMEAESVENYYQMGNSAYAPLRIAPKLTFADAVSKTANQNLTRRQYSLINHQVHDYYDYTSFKLNISFNAMKCGPTNEKSGIVFSRDKYSFLERQLLMIQHPYALGPLESRYSNPITDFQTESNLRSDSNIGSLLATNMSLAPSHTPSLRSFTTLRSKCSDFKALFKK